MYNLDLSALSIEDIVEEYKLLHERHQQLKERSEEDAQRLHELKRSLDTSLAAERYLAQELEHLTAQAQSLTPSSDPRLQQEFDDLQRKYRNLKLEHETLQQEYDSKIDEATSLKAKLESASRDLEANALLKANRADDEYAARLNALELENAELMQKLTEYEEAKVKRTFTLAEQEKTIEILKDQIDCLEQNLISKRDELEEKLQLLESTQEQLVDANAKIAMLSSAPEHNDRKGNSLFAEVDDQRQVMKQLLASQKKSYLEMKKIFNDSQTEIHRLKRENVAMHTELEACSTIFCSADRTYQNKLNERIRQLMQQNAKLERNLNLSQERLRELAKEKSVTWLDSMLDFCKYELAERMGHVVAKLCNKLLSFTSYRLFLLRETDEMKAQLHSMHLQKATLEDQLRNVQQDMARWRFESLKSRCILIDREYLLTENNITFKPVQAMEFNISEEQQKAALPRIVSGTPNPVDHVAAPTECNILETPLKEATDTIDLITPYKNTSQAVIKEETIEEEEQLVIKPDPEPIASKELNSILSPPPSTPPLGKIKVKSEEELLACGDQFIPAKPQRKGTPVKLSQIKREFTEDKDEKSPVPAKPQRKGTPVKPKEEPLHIKGIGDAKPLPKGTPIRPKAAIAVTDTAAAASCFTRSILVRKRELFAEDNQKNVQFNSNGPIVHHLSPDIGSPAPCSKENMHPASQDVKPDVKKSQNIIRRIIVPPRPKPANS